MKYPYISTSMNNLLFYAKDTATLIGDESNQFSNGFKLTADESKLENNTHEFLSNTWGVVESKEHAEFIIELARSAGLKVWSMSDNDKVKIFAVERGELCLLTLPADELDGRELKQITIPLPPKAKEWPQVGDKVRWDKNDYLGTVKAISEDKAWCKLDNGLYYTINFDRLAKPKSKQELLIEELQTKLCNNNAVDNYILACDIINGEIEGLSYE